MSNHTHIDSSKPAYATSIVADSVVKSFAALDRRYANFEPEYDVIGNAPGLPSSVGYDEKTPTWPGGWAVQPTGNGSPDWSVPTYASSKSSSVQNVEGDGDGVVDGLEDGLVISVPQTCRQ